jgi:hypothetical protein
VPGLTRQIKWRLAVLRRKLPGPMLQQQPSQPDVTVLGRAMQSGEPGGLFGIWIGAMFE